MSEAVTYPGLGLFQMELMVDITPQERLALIVIAVLITGGTLARHAVVMAEAEDAIQFSTDAADTLSAHSGRRLRERVAGEVAEAKIRSQPLAKNERIDPNTAPAEQLDRLPGIGPAIADRIVEHRQRSGRFRSVEDLSTVSGIGPAALARIAPHLTLGRSSAVGGGRASAERRVDINRADASELEALPGIGPSIAQRIVEYRTANGKFRDWEDIENVAGVGPRLRERLQSAARLGP